ncbi:MAG: co-chaperone GroES [Candidatus Uhrbacteria bacterium]
MIKPLNEYIILKPLSKEEVTASGIILPDTVDKDRPEQGEVVAVGPGKLLEDGKRSLMEVKVGDKVMFKKYTPDEIKVDKVEYLVIRMDDVVGVIE